MTGTDSHPDEKTILAYVDGELVGKEAAAVREHCDCCDACRRVRDGFRRVARMLESQPEAEPIRSVTCHCF